jgi:HSP20 family protein
MTLFSLSREFDRLERLQEQIERAFDRPFWDAYSYSGRQDFPPVNVFEERDAYVVRLEVPGLDAEALQVETRGLALMISGKRPETSPVGASVHRRERWTGEFSRALKLPADADTAAARASCKNGILTVRVPKREEARARQIEVKTSSA